MIDFKKLIKISLLFFFFLLALVFNFSLFRIDTFANYGFSYAISIGEIPYRDFNMVITPLSPMLYSVGLLFNKSLLALYMEQALLLLLLFYILYKLVDKKVLIFLIILCLAFPVTFPAIIFPGYNYICILLLMILVFLEHNKKSDYLIGIILGLMFCTKQTIGVAVFIPCIYYLFVDYKKFFKRFLGFLIPVLILFLYLLITDSFRQFIDLCFLGLFNFGSNNRFFNLICVFSFIVGFIYIIYNIFRDRKNIINYYFLFFSVISFPIIDHYHVALFLIGPLFLLIKNISFPDKWYKVIVSLFITLFILDGIMVFMFLSNPVFAQFNNFTFYIVSKKYKSDILKLNEYLNAQDKDIIYLLRGSENYMFKIMNNKEITYYDLPNHGNYGYNGENVINSEIDKMHDVIFVVDKSLCSNDDSLQQYICSFKDSAVDKSELINIIGTYEVYYRK